MVSVTSDNPPQAKLGEKLRRIKHCNQREVQSQPLLRVIRYYRHCVPLRVPVSLIP